MKKKSAIKPWAAILLTFAGILGVIGVTILTLFALGKLNQTDIKPADIDFVQELDESDGLGFFDASTSTFSVSTDFKMTITSSTQDVTARNVTLSLSNSGKPDADGYISNNIIKIPQNVLLNRPFEVELMHDANGFVQGGNCTITAKSENVLAQNKTIQVCVDVPVSDIRVGVKDKDSISTGAVQEVVTGTKFTVGTQFVPQKSEYIFGNALEKKKVFYSTSSSMFISYNEETGVFTANQRSTSETQVSAYVFANSYYETKFMKEFLQTYPTASTQKLTEEAMAYFAKNPTHCKSQTIGINVVDVVVDNVSFNHVAAMDKNMQVDKYYTLKANSFSGNSLGATIKAGGVERRSLMGNVGIKVPKGVGAFKIAGGQVIKVEKLEAETKISRENFNTNFDYSAAEENVEYYILPNNSPIDYGDYFWKFSSTDVLENVTLNLNFFSEKENGMWENFDAFNQEQSFVIAVKPNSLEDAPAWQEEPIELEITFSEGEEDEVVVNKASTDLSKFVKVNAQNTYKTVRYFLLTDGFAGDLAEYFNIAEERLYKTNYTGANIEFSGFEMPSAGWGLYEITDPDGLLIANKALPKQAGRVYVVAATVKTDVDDKLDLDGENYKIIKVSGAKQVQVTSELSIVNMSPTFAVDTDIGYITENQGATNETKKYYIPAINYDKTTTQSKNVLSFSLKLNKHGQDDGVKLLDAFANGSLKLVCKDDKGASQHLSLLVPTEIASEDETSVTVNSEIQINENLFKTQRETKELSLYLSFEGKEKEIVDFNEISNLLTVYYQTPTTHYGAYENEFSSTHLVDGQKVLSAYVKVFNDSESLSITWINGSMEDVSVDGLDALNDLYLNFTLLDQYGRQIDPRVYDVMFVEETLVDGKFVPATTKYIEFGQNKINNFPGNAGSGEKTTYLAVYIVDVNNNNKIVTDANGSKLTFPKIRFNVESKGITKVEQDSSQNMAEHTYADSASTSSATVSKVVEPDKSITMADLIKVYASNSTTPIDAERLVFHLTKASASNVELANMMFINGSSNKPNLSDFTENNAITSISFAGVFGGNGHTINFVVTDQKRTFQIDLAFNCLPATTIDNEFAAYANTQSKLLKEDGTYYTYGDFMRSDPKNQNTPRLFANNTYDLNTVLPLSNGYTWSVRHFYTSQANSVTVEDGKLKIAEVYKCTTVTITIYYGVQSTLAPYKEVTLYINPSLLVKENVESLNANPMVNLQNTDTIFEQLFEFYNAIKVLETGEFKSEYKTNISAAAEYRDVNFTTVDGYLAIEKDTTNKFVLKINGGTLELELGKTYTQTFNMVRNADAMDASVVRVTADNLCKVVAQTENKGAELAITLGFGTDETSTIEAIFAGRVISEAEANGRPDGTTEKILTGTFNANGQQKTYALLSAGEKYQLKENFSIHSTQGQLSQGLNQLMAGKGFSSILYDRDSCTIKYDAILSGGTQTLTVLITVPCMISRFGDKFVAYGSGDFNADGEFVLNEHYINAHSQFADVNLGQLLTLEVLENQNIYQQLKAGRKYQILHDARYQSGDSGIGFYFNSHVLGDSGNVDINIVKSYYGASKTNKTFASVITENGKKYLHINSISSDYNDVYIVLSATVTYGRSTYTYYYRVKVQSNFVATDVCYPYDVTGTSNQDRAEYLDANSMYFVDGAYRICLEEEFNNINSRNTVDISKRFGDLKDASGNILTNAKKQYSIYSINGTVGADSSTQFVVCTIENQADANPIFVAQLKNQQQKVRVVVKCTYYIDGVQAVGSELYYTFAFNLGETYTTTLVSENNDVSKDGNYKYLASITAGTEEAAFDASITYTRTSGSGIVTIEEKDFAVLVANPKTAQKILYKVAVAAKDVTLQDGRTILAGQPILGAADAWETEEQEELNGLKKGEDYYYTYAYLNGKTLHVKALDDVSEDDCAKIVFFTHQRPAFELLLTVKGFYQYILNNNIADSTGKLTLKANDTYTLGTDQDAQSNNFIFENVQSTNAVQVSSVDISLANADVKYGDVTYGDLVAIEKASDWKQTKLRFAHLTLGGATFNFKVTINGTVNEDGATEGGYSFIIVATVAQSFDASKGISKDRGADGVVGGTEITVNANYFATGTFTDNKGFKFMFKQADNTYTETATFKAEVVGEENGSKETKQFTLVYIYCNEDVAMDSDERYGLELFEVDATYTYKALPNVKLNVNYPKPDGTNTLKYEYVQAGAMFYGAEVKTIVFQFNKPAPFAGETHLQATDRTSFNRVDIERVKTKTVNADGDSEEAEVSVDLDYTISIESIQNTSVLVDDGEEYSAQAANIASGKADEYGIANVLRFRLNNATNGNVTFKITVNKVEVLYTVRVTSQPTVKYVQNSPNYSGEGTDASEVIFAEDLVGKETTIFAPNRILKYSLKNQNLINQTLYLKLTKGAQTKTFSFVAKEGLVNYDLGESMKDYVYAGIYTGMIANDNGQVVINEKTKLDDAKEFSVLPYLTERVEAQYADGTKIKLFDYQKNIDEQNKDDVKNTVRVTNGFYRDLDGSVKPSMEEQELQTEVGTQEFKMHFRSALHYYKDNGYSENSNYYSFDTFTYKVSLKLDFQVLYNADNVADSNGVVSLPRAVDLNANTEKSTTTAVSLLSERVAGKTAGFGITRVRDDQVYTKKMLEDSGARISLATYGFAEGGMGINNNTGNNLMQAAWDLHKDLQRTLRTSPTGNEVKYITGLLPRAAETNGTRYTASYATGTGITGSDGTYNYISTAGNIEGSTYATDWNLYAQGASNDGNYVLIKITYSIGLGGDKFATVSHNILFRVLPNSNILFKRSSGTTALTTQIIDQQNSTSVATNVQDQYIIEDDNFVQDEQTKNYIHTVKLVDFDSDNQITNQGAIVANMRGGKTNTANNFVYTYKTLEQDGGFNDVKIAGDDIAYNNYNKLNKALYNDLHNVEGDDNSGRMELGWYDNRITINDSPQIIDATYKHNAMSTKPLQFVFTEKLDLGERHFFVDFEDLYGYRGRFYITLVSGNNPQVDSATETTLTEGKGLVFGAKFNTVSTGNSTGDGATATFKQFTYTTKVNTSSANEYYNDIKITKKTEDLFNVTGATLTATLAKEKTKTTTKDGKEVVEIVVPAGGTIRKTINSVGNTISIVDATNWSYGNTSLSADADKITQEDLEGSSIVLQLTLASNATEGTIQDKVGTYTVEYGKKNGASFEHAQDGDKTIGTLTQDYTVDGTGEIEFGDDTSYHKITLNGIKAFGFNNSDIAVDANSIADFYSDVNNIAVQQVEFMYNGESLGTAQNVKNEDGTDKKSLIQANLITNPAYSFIGSNGEVKNGCDTKYSTGGEDITSGLVEWLIDKFTNNFKVPHIDGKYFGTGTTLSGVSMVVTVVGKTEDNNDVSVKLAPYTVTLQRELKAKLPEIITTLDNDKADLPTFDKTVQIYNDTLEINLQPYESVSFAITDLTKIESAKVNPNSTITFTGTRNDVAAEKTEKITTITASSYAVTKYVGLLASISDLQSNDPSKTKPMLYLVNHTKNSGKDAISIADTNTLNTFVYNGSTLELAEYANIAEEDMPTNAAGDKVNVCGTKDIQLSANAGTVGKSSTTLHIHNKAELGGGKERSEKLYYLIGYNYNGRENNPAWYQHQQQYKVATRYKSATPNPNSLTEGTIIVDDYLKVADEDGKAFYAISLAQWGKHINLTDGKDNKFDTDGKTLLTLASVNGIDYQFKFSIGQGGGTAFIDQHGLITTSDDFTIGPGIIFVDIAIKVSGQDGNFEDVQNVVSIGSVAIRLKNNTISCNGSMAGTYEYGNSVVTIKDGFKASQVLTAIDSTTSITDTTLSATCDLNDPSNNKPLVFKDVFGGSVEEIKEKKILTTLFNDNYHNITYHLVAIAKGENTTYINFNNDSRYTFAEPGLFTLTFVMDARNGSSFEQQMFTINILVYDDSSTAYRESFRVATSDLNYTLPAKDGETWWLVENGIATELGQKTAETTLTVAVKVGENHKTFIVASENGTYKYVDATIFAYDNTKSFDIALGAGNTLNMANIDQTLVRYYELDDKNNVAEKEYKNAFFQSSAAGAIFSKKYLAINNQDEAVLVTINYKIVSTTIESQPSVYIAVQDDETAKYFKADDIIAEVKNALGLAKETFEEFNVYLRGGNGVLTKLSNVQKDKDAYKQQLNLVVIYKKAAENRKIATMMLNMFAYNALSDDLSLSKDENEDNVFGQEFAELYNKEDADKINADYQRIQSVGVSGNRFVLEFIGEDNARYPVKNLNTTIIAMLNATCHSGNKLAANTTVSVWNFNERITEVKLTQPLAAKDYFVQVNTANGSEYYLFNITFLWPKEEAKA